MLGAVGLAGCLKQNPGFQDEAGESGLTSAASMGATATTEGTTVSTDMSPGTGGTTLADTTVTTTTGPALPTTGADASSTGSTSTGALTTDGTTQTDTSTGESDAPATCAEARDQGGLTSGVYTLQVPGDPGETVDVWCEQEVAGGGWLLVGRSAPSERAPMFGWGIASGDLGDDAVPYALGLLALEFPASEVLLGSRDDGKQPSDHVYRLSTPVGFPLGFDLGAGVTTAIETVLGDCAPDNGPTMLRSLGFTKLTDRFRLRDVVDGGADDVHGLLTSGFGMPEDCDNGGELNGSQGVIFVR